MIYFISYRAFRLKTVLADSYMVAYCPLRVFFETSLPLP
jgi:hypothetical protein